MAKTQLCDLQFCSFYLPVTVISIRKRVILIHFLEFCMNLSWTKPKMNPIKNQNLEQMLQETEHQLEQDLLDYLKKNETLVQFTPENMEKIEIAHRENYDKLKTLFNHMNTLLNENGM